MRRYRYLKSEILQDSDQRLIDGEWESCNEEGNIACGSGSYRRPLPSIKESKRIMIREIKELYREYDLPVPKTIKI